MPAALTVDKADIFAAQIFDPFDAFGIAFGNDEPLIAHDQVDQLHGNIRQVAFNIRQVVFAGFGIQQMRAGQGDRHRV